MTSLEGRVALVTGAARGIGLETACALAAAGADVVAAVRDPSSAGDLRGRLAATGGRHLVAPCDVGDYAQAERTVALALDRFGGLDVLVNNAGVVQPIGLVADTDPGLWREGVIVNLVGPYDMARAALPALLERRGCIVNVSSGAALAPREGWSAYCAGKAGLAMLTRSLALEYGAAGLRVFGFQPGVVDTGMQSEIRASGINEVSRLRREDLAPAGLPAKAIVFLCGPGATDLSGGEVSIRDAAFRARAGL